MWAVHSNATYEEESAIDSIAPAKSYVPSLFVETVYIYDEWQIILFQFKIWFFRFFSDFSLLRRDIR